MKISTSKTEKLRLSRNPVQCFFASWRSIIEVGGEVERIKYLGVAFTSNGRQDEELDVRSIRQSKCCNAIFALFSRIKTIAIDKGKTLSA